MKIAAKSVASFLASPAPSRAVLIYGADEGMVRERAQQLRDGFLGASPDPMALISYEESELLNDRARLADEIASFNMMVPKRFFLIRASGDKLSGLLKEALGQLHSDVFMVVMAGELASRSSLRALFEADKTAAALACYRDDDGRDTRQLISKKFAEAGITAHSDAIQYLCSQLGNDRYVTYQELDKIITYLGDDRQLSLEAVSQLVDYNRDTQLDDIVMALADRSLSQLDRMLEVHKREGTSAVAYIRAINRYFLRLYQVQAAMAAGQSQEAAMNALWPKVFFKQADKMCAHLRAWPNDALVKALRLLEEAELACKTSDLPAYAASSRKLFQVTQIR